MNWLANAAGKVLGFVQTHKDPIFKAGIVVLLGAAGAVLFGQLASDDDNEPASDEGDTTTPSEEG